MLVLNTAQSQKVLKELCGLKTGCFTPFLVLVPVFWLLVLTTVNYIHSRVPLAKKMQFKPKPYCFEYTPCGKPRLYTEQFQLQILHPSVPVNHGNISVILIFAIQVEHYWKKAISMAMIESKSHQIDTDSTTIYHKTCACQTRLCFYNCYCLFCVSVLCFWNHKAPEPLPYINAYSTVTT